VNAVLAVTVPSWAWTITTFAATIVALALIAVLLAHILISAVPFRWLVKVPLKSIDQGAGVAPAASCDGGRRAGSEAALRRRLARAAVPLLACFVIVVLVRFGTILAERPGP
jgi:hypothetical protein